MLMLPTIDAAQHAFEKMKDTVAESKNQAQPIVIRPNQFKS